MRYKILMHFEVKSFCLSCDLWIGGDSETSVYSTFDGTSTIIAYLNARKRFDSWPSSIRSIQLISIFLEVTSVTFCDLKARKRALKDFVFCEVTMIHLLFEEIASRRGTSFPFYFNHDEYHEVWKKRSSKVRPKQLEFILSKRCIGDICTCEQIRKHAWVATI